MSKKEYKISGLHCQHCLSRVKNALEQLNEVEMVKIFQEEELLSIVANQQPDLQILNDTLEEVGDYRLSEI